ncbi:hypothetical protein V5O48_002784 [Marasmius crinis-equi]|uniref:Uncharacterized protein n=1 Tax=Marasmius crinis-equi TaxID=585013 RepID=A0ABR3FUP8_9AGAR
MPAHPANSPFAVEVADAHPQVDVSRRRSRSNAVLHTTMLFRSSTSSVTRVKTEGAERVRIAITGPEATAFGNPTFGERTSVTITHRDVNHALRNSSYDRDPHRPVRFVTVAPIPEEEVLPPPATPAIDLPGTEFSTLEKQRDVDYQPVDYDSLVPPDTLEVMEEWAENAARQHVADQVDALLAEKAASRGSRLRIDTSSSGVPFPCASPSPVHSEFPERPSAPCPLSPFSDEDEDFPLGVRPDGPVLAPCKSFGESSVADSVADDITPRAQRPVPVMSKKSRNGSSSSLPQTASPAVSLAKTLKLGFASPKSQSTSNLACRYTDGAPLNRGATVNGGGLKLRLPVVKKLLGLGKDKSVGKSETGNNADISPATPTRKSKGQKRYRDDDDADENPPPSAEKERRIIKDRNIRRRLVA